MSGDMESTPEAKDGLTADPERDSAARLLLDAALGESNGGNNTEGKGSRLLLIEGGCGALAAHFAPRFPETISHNYLYRNHTVSQALLAGQGLTRVRCLLGDLPRAGKTPGLEPDSCDEIIFRLGRGTALINAALMEAFRLLRKGGNFWVSGHNQEGIKSFAKRAEAHFGNMHLVRIKSSCRLIRFQKESDAPIDPVEDPRYFEMVPLEIGLPKIGKLPYLSKPGIFSYRSTDLGTAALARHFPDCAGREVLDLGCGSGVLSLAAFKAGASSVLAVDANAIATACAEMNFQSQNLPGRVLCTNLTEGIEADFDLILSNPPFHHGSETDFSFPGKILDAILPRLRSGGSVYLVANRFLDYVTQGERRFKSVEILAREQGYCVYRMTAA